MPRHRFPMGRLYRLMVLLLLLSAPLCLAHGRRQEAQPEEETPYIKIPLRFARVADIMSALGRPTIPDSFPRGAVGAAQQLIPEGILDIFGFSPDNTVIIRGRADAIREMTRNLALLDVPTQQVQIHLEALLTVTDRTGKHAPVRLAVNGRAFGDQPLFLKLGYQTKAGSTGFAVQEGHSDARIEAQVQGDGAIRLACQWKVAFVVRLPSAAPVHLDKEVTSGCIVHSGLTDTLTNATVPLDSGSATLTLTVTPTLRAINTVALPGTAN